MLDYFNFLLLMNLSVVVSGGLLIVEAALIQGALFYTGAGRNEALQGLCDGCSFCDCKCVGF